jgi:hypothetical protein
MNHARAGTDTGNNTMVTPNTVKRTSERRMTGTTYNSDITDSSDFSLPEEEQGLVKKLFKQEMVHSLARVAAARVRKNPKKQGNMKDTEEAIRKLATMVLHEETDEDTSPTKTGDGLKPDQDLRDLLRNALDPEEDDGWEADSTPLHSSMDLKDAPLDIWDSGFWGSSHASVDEESSNMDASGHSSARTTFTRTSFVSTDRTESEATNGSQSLQEFLANLKEVSSDSDSAGGDDDSVLSDITGLSEVFPEDVERSAIAREQRSKILLEALPASLEIRDIKEKKRKVVFSEVHLRKYERILCDNPAVSSGPALGVGWRYKPQTPVSVDDFEKKKGKRRGKSDLLMSRDHREKMVRRMGHSEREIADMVRSINRTKNQRRQTLNNLGVEKMEVAVESAKKRLKSLLSFKGKK